MNRQSALNAGYSKKSDTDYILIFLQYWLLFLVGICVVAVSRIILPSKYFIDSQTIQHYAQLIRSGVPFPSTDGFANAARFYIALGLDHLSPMIVGYITYLVFFCVMCFAIGRSKLTNLQYIVIFGWNFEVAVYMGQFSKEAFTTIVIAVVLRLMTFKSKYKLIPALLLLSLYANFNRKYWFIIIFLTVVLFFTSRIRNNGLKFTSRLLLSFLPFAYYDHSGSFITDSRTQVNAIISAISSGSDTAISNLVTNTSIGTDYINWLDSTIKLVIPYPLFLNFSLFHVAFGCLELLTITILFSIYGVLKIQGSSAQWWLFYWVISFIAVQGMFEPDYGSFVKHQIDFIFILFYLIAFTRKQKKGVGRNEIANLARGRVRQRWTIDLPTRVGRISN